MMGQAFLPPSDVARARVRAQTLMQTEAWSAVPLSKRLKIGIATAYTPVLTAIEWSDAASLNAPANEGAAQILQAARENFALVIPMVESLFSGEPTVGQVWIMELVFCA